MPLSAPWAEHRPPIAVPQAPSDIFTRGPLPTATSYDTPHTTKSRRIMTLVAKHATRANSHSP
eukprot:15446808-Alexandrium_andersonii.AAC.1